MKKSEMNYGIPIIPNIKQKQELYHFPYYIEDEWLINCKTAKNIPLKFLFNLRHLQQLNVLCNTGYFTFILPTFYFQLPFNFLNQLEYLDPLLNLNIRSANIYFQITLSRYNGKEDSCNPNQILQNVDEPYRITYNLLIKHKKRMYFRKYNSNLNSNIYLLYTINKEVLICNSDEKLIKKLIFDLPFIKHRFFCENNCIIYTKDINSALFRSNYLPNPKLLQQLPHNTHFFTQGLYIDNDFIIESTGQYGLSSIRKIDKKTGAILQSNFTDRYFFAEGISKYQNYYYQFTWLEHTLLIYDTNTLKLVDQKQLNDLQDVTQIWGATNDENNIIFSTGSNKLYYFNPSENKICKILNIHYKNRIVSRINDICYIEDNIYANIWPEYYIIKIDVFSGEVVDVFDLRFLTNLSGPKAKEMNGIAYDESQQTLIITGKYWSRYFFIKPDSN